MWIAMLLLGLLLFGLLGALTVACDRLGGST
jgi:hypothetical protein